MSHGHHNKAHALSAAGQRHSWVDATAPASDSDGSEGYEDPAVESDTESEPYDEEEDVGPGWVEGLTSLKEGEGATALLDGQQLAAKETQVPPPQQLLSACHVTWQLLKPREANDRYSALTSAVLPGFAHRALIKLVTILDRMPLHCLPHGRIRLRIQ